MTSRQQVFTREVSVKEALKLIFPNGLPTKLNTAASDPHKNSSDTNLENMEL